MGIVVAARFGRLMGDGQPSELAAPDERSLAGIKIEATAEFPVVGHPDQAARVAVLDKGGANFRLSRGCEFLTRTPFHGGPPLDFRAFRPAREQMTQWSR